jgi:hypothetical protein
MMSDVEQWEHDMEKMRMDLENCRLLAARHRKEDWALKQATPHEQLIDELRDSTIPKTEREHAAAREIEKNQDRIAAGHRLALELECLLTDTKDLPTVSRWWESGMEALDAWQKLFPYNGPRLGD